MEFLQNYLIAGLIFAGIDAIWLIFIANKFYKAQLGSLLKAKPDMRAAILFYLLYIVGIVFFALQPALQSGQLADAAGRGALLGLLMYATYDLTNQATLKNWPTKITIVDLIWGTFVTSLTTVIAFLILN